MPPMPTGTVRQGPDSVSKVTEDPTAKRRLTSNAHDGEQLFVGSSGRRVNTLVQLEEEAPPE